MLNVRLTGVWEIAVHLAVAGNALMASSCCPFSHEMSWRSET